MSATKCLKILLGLRQAMKAEWGIRVKNNRILYESIIGRSSHIPPALASIGWTRRLTGNIYLASEETSATSCRCIQKGPNSGASHLGECLFRSGRTSLDASRQMLKTTDKYWRQGRCLTAQKTTGGLSSQHYTQQWYQKQDSE